jgi:hypothetical protein
VGEVCLSAGARLILGEAARGDLLTFISDTAVGTGDEYEGKNGVRTRKIL